MPFCWLFDEMCANCVHKKGIIKMINVLTAIFLDTRRPLKDGNFPIKLRLTHKRDRRYFPTEYSCSQDDFEKIMAPKPRAPYKDIRLELDEMEQQARSVLKKMSVFTFELFEKKFSDNSHNGDIFVLFDNYIKELEKDGRINTSDSYKSALNSLKSYSQKKKLPFANITVDFLKNYERWMVSQKKSLTTVGIYLRYVRALFNEQLATGEIDKEIYPFGKRKYLIPSGRNKKKALTLAQIKKIIDYIPNNEYESKARDYWVFSYLSNGINTKDMALLRYKNVSSTSITFIRAKTARTTRQDLKPIVVALHPDVTPIIERWGNKPVLPEAYVFPILSDGLSPRKEAAAIKQATKTINEFMDRIATALEIDAEVTTYTARHSFSTILKRSGASTEFISESLGHTDLRTTEAYLDSFEDDTKRKYMAALTAFPEETEKS